MDTTTDHWDKRLCSLLLGEGFTLEQASRVVGIVAEERMQADRVGYIRGYNNGYKDGFDKANLGG